MALMSDINTSYVSWTTPELINWIISLDSSYQTYQQILTTSFTKNGITGLDINALDRADLKEYGIINLTHRKNIYSSIQTLIVNKKRRDSLQTNPANITSLSEDDCDAKEDKLTLLTDTEKNELLSNGYCMMADPLNNKKAVCTVQGYIRNNFSSKYMIKDLIRTIINYYNSRYNIDLYTELICVDDTDTKYSTFLVPKVNISLSGVLRARMDCGGNIIEIKKVSHVNMHHVLRYLGHHKGVKPEEIAKPIRSVKMERIVADKWDAEYINSLSKKVIFQVILAANYLDCASLLHLGAAKIATLIKGKSPEEIRQILADDGDE